VRSPATLAFVFLLAALPARAQSVDVDTALRDLAANYDRRSRAETLKLVEPVLAVPSLTEAQRIEALRIKGNALIGAGRNDDAVTTLQAALTALGDSPDAAVKARLQLALASAYRGQKKLDLAMTESLQAEEAILRLGDEELLLECLTGRFYYTIGDDDVRIQEIADRVLPLAEKLGDNGAKGRIYHFLADRDFSSGRYGDAVRRLELAVPNLRAGGPREQSSLARALTSLGRARRAHGLPASALDAYREAMEVQTRIGDRLGVVQSWNAMGVAWANLGKGEKALECYGRGLAEAQSLGDKSATQFMEGAVANALFDLGKASEAIPIYERVLSDNPDPYIARFRLAGLAQAYLAVGRAEDALKTVDRALAMDQSSMPDAVANFRFTRARANAALGRQADAIADARQSLDTFERIRSSLLPLDFVKRGYSDLIQDVFDFTVGALEESGRDAEAVTTAEEGRGRALADLLASRMTRAAPSAAGSAERGAATLLTGRPSADTAPAGLDSPVATRALPAADLSALAARHHTTIVSYWVGKDRSIAWVIRGDGSIFSSTLPVTRTRLQQLVDQASKPPVIAVEGTSKTPDAALAALRALYDALIAPIDPLLPAAGARLTIVPHGPLFSLAFGALRSARGKYLIERYTLHDVPSGAVLALAASRPESAGDSWLLVADPQPRPRGAAQLPALPEARREIAAAAAVAPEGVVRRLSGTTATETAFRAALADARVVHIAAHAVVPSADATGAFVAFGRDPATTSADGDGKLTAAEIYDLHVGADLVVLSACRSGRGRVTGDGVAGFTRAFISAGAKTVVASLWDAPDESARRVMARFYDHLTKGEAAAESLRAAQLALLADLRAGRVKVASPAGDVVLPAHPAIWAGFRLHGVP
jgi:CHAT domain-containing protein